MFLVRRKPQRSVIKLGGETRVHAGCSGAPTQAPRGHLESARTEGPWGRRGLQLRPPQRARRRHSPRGHVVWDHVLRCPLAESRPVACLCAVHGAGSPAADPRGRVPRKSMGDAVTSISAVAGKNSPRKRRTVCPVRYLASTARDQRAWSMCRNSLTPCLLREGKFRVFSRTTKRASFFWLTWPSTPGISLINEKSPRRSKCGCLVC